MKKKIAIIGITLILLSGVGEVTAIDVCSWYLPPLWGLCITSIFFNYFFSGIEGFTSHLGSLILMNPDPADVNPLIASYLDLLHPVFVLSILVVSFYLIFMSGSPGGRSRAKTLFLKLLLTMILVSLSPEIFKILLGISEGLTKRTIAGVTEGSIHFGLLEDAAFIFLKLNPLVFSAMLFIITFTLLSIGIRYVLVLIVAALFPITILLYVLELPLIGAMGKEIGARMWRWTVGVIFAQFVQGICLAITAIAFGNLSEVAGWGTFAAFLVGLAGLVLIAFAPLMAMGILKWIGGALMGAGVMLSFVNPALGFAVTAAGGLMMGMGPGSSLMAAGGGTSMAYAARMGQRGP